MWTVLQDQWWSCHQFTWHCIPEDKLPMKWNICSLAYHIFPHETNQESRIRFSWSFILGRFTRICLDIPIFVMIRQQQQTLLGISACITGYIFYVECTFWVRTYIFRDNYTNMNEYARTATLCSHFLTYFSFFKTHLMTLKLLYVVQHMFQLHFIEVLKLGPYFWVGRDCSEWVDRANIIQSLNCCAISQPLCSRCIKGNSIIPNILFFFHAKIFKGTFVFVSS